MSNLQKLQKIKTLINESQIHFHTPDRQELQEYIEVLITIEKEYQ
jgi:predicted RNA polymerase sigma factor